MDKRVATFVEEQPRLTVLALLGLSVVLLAVIWLAPAFLSLIVAAAIAAGWSWWLETSTAQARPKPHDVSLS
jgi:hypothetical protein